MISSLFIASTRDYNLKNYTAAGRIEYLSIYYLSTASVQKAVKYTCQRNVRIERSYLVDTIFRRVRRQIKMFNADDRKTSKSLKKKYLHALRTAEIWEMTEATVHNVIISIRSKLNLLEFYHGVLGIIVSFMNGNCTWKKFDHFRWEVDRQDKNIWTEQNRLFLIVQYDWGMTLKRRSLAILSLGAERQLASE